jgi:fumarate hydratase class II
MKRTYSHIWTACVLVTILLAGSLLAISAQAQADQPVDATLGVPPPVVSVPPGAPVPAGGTQAILDDFNRADGPIGPNWTVHDGYCNVSNNAAVCGSMGRATFNGAPGDGNYAEADIATNGTALQYTGLLLNYGAGATNLFIKVQQQNSSGLFEYGACYTGNNGPAFGLGFFPLTSSFSTAHMTVTRVGNDVTIAVAGQSGNFQLNVMLPLIGYKLIESLRLLANVSRVLADKAVAGFTVNEARLKDALARNPILVTALNPVIGYEKGAAIAKKAYAEGKPILEVAAKNTDLPVDELRRLLDPADLARGGIKGGTSGGG